MVDTQDSKSCANRHGGSSPLQGSAAALRQACLHLLDSRASMLAQRGREPPWQMRRQLSGIGFLTSISLQTMEVNILAFIAIALFLLIPTSFLLILYVKTESQGT